jgi:putative ABC transport system permease protein
MQARSEREVRDPLRISAWACGFVILIALMGLLGMAAYATETRVKEIGIRKVMGAHASAIVYLLSKSTIKLILISALFAIPCGYFLSASIVQSFAFRPALSFWVLPATLIFILGLALLTISTQTVKAALTNPARTLREE